MSLIDLGNTSYRVARRFSLFMLGVAVVTAGSLLIVSPQRNNSGVTLGILGVAHADAPSGGDDAGDGGGGGDGDGGGDGGAGDCGGADDSGGDSG